MPLDSVTWAALAFCLTAIGAAWTYVAWHRRGAAAGIRGVAWTLLPVAAWATGTLELAGDVADDVGRWAVHLVFSPLVWLGIVLAGMSVVLFGVSGAMRTRGIGSRKPKDSKGSKGTVPAAKPGRALGAPRSRKSAGPVDDMDDIEAILKKHGIS
jgi:hypothetical protein